MLYKTQVQKCKECGADIVFIKTRGGKFMPCNAKEIHYKADPSGNKNIITSEGDIVRCTYDTSPETATGKGYVPHWGSCTAPDKFRRHRG